jgi:tripartite-type tricarboxylate transporter receptor subunit TctC
LFGGATGRMVECVHYKGAQEFASDLRGGRTHASFVSILQARTWQQSNSAKIVGNANLDPSHLMPDLRTFRQAGLERAVIPLSHWIFAPPGTPDNVAAQVYSAFDKAMRSPEVEKHLPRVRQSRVPQPPASYEVNVRQARALFDQIVDAQKLASE